MTQVCVIGIYVPDIQKAIDFYTTVLGFEVNKQYGPKIVTLLHGELPIVLEESEKSSFNANSNPSGVVLALKTEDINHTVNVLKEHKVDFIVDEPTQCPPGRFISFRDPFGNVLEYLQFDI
ncbi:VOC family protein [Paenisporosarcina quisquiliarum]|uniref:VOC family protein n=1 Tax=Paenisporosarcina quisquiliarum TaxID=365346 RepID=A0A9X3LI12_9BACL|nr:VOC family protein [Paenisporosarcina quisquiliarum]MCZ8537715.1 VOC family protein [Paenisporosarcina quisquiliarum]